MSVIDLTEDAFNSDVLTSSEPILVEFWGSWCTACKAMFPHLDKLAEGQETLKIAKLSVEDAPEVARNYGIRSIPAMLIFKDGEVVQTINGSRSYEKLTEELSDFL